MNLLQFEKKARPVMLVIAASGLTYSVMRFTSCGIEAPPQPVENKPTPIAQVSCGNLEVGQTRATACPDGSGNRIEACTEQGLVIAVDCERPRGNECGKTTFAEVKPILTQKCVSCHPGYDGFATASAKGSAFVSRILLPVGSTQRMPKSPAPPLSDEQKDLFKKWQLDGFLETCPRQNANRGAFINFDQIETAIIDKLNALNEEDRLNSRFLVLSHKINENVPESDFDIFSQGANKVVNSVAAKARRLNKLEAFGPNNSIMRIDLDSFELQRADWDRVIAADPLKIESFTNKGRVIKFLTQNLRPWMHFDNFINVSQNNAAVYYALTGVASTFNQFVKDLGVNYAGDFLNFRAMLIGTNFSPISIQKNRLISRHDSVDNYLWFTYDSIALQGVRQRNLFEFPLLKETGSVTGVFEFFAGEAIFTLPNQMQGYALFDARGNRQNAAPLDLVTDVNSPVTPEIRNALSCHRCHSAGLIPANDEVRDHVLRNASQFNANDVQLVRTLYRVNSVNAAQFEKDNSRFARALQEIGVDPGLDPINYAADRFLLNWDLAQTAAFLFLEKDEFAQLLNESAVGRAQVGQLLSGGHITNEQFTIVLPQLIRDLRLFQDPLGG